MESVGTRKLRLELPRQLGRVRNGETIEITERGVPVARLVPLPGRASILDRMIAEGRVRPATRSLRDLPPPLEASYSLTDVLIQMREEEER
jgi:prevent-host-death family protein